MRSSRTTVTFSHPFEVYACPDELPAGTYEILVEEELLQGLSFSAYRRTATFLTACGDAGRRGRTEMLPVTERELQLAIDRDRALSGTTAESEAALSLQEDLK